MWLRKCLFACLILAALCFNAEAARLVWDANTESDLAGYKIHYGLASGQYTNTVDVGNVTQWEIPAGWPRDQSYYFAATAYSPTDESEYSNEVVYFADVPPPAAATDVRVSWLEVTQQMAIAYVSGNTGTGDAGDTTISAGAINAVSGNAIVVCVINYDSGSPDITGIADTAGNDAKYALLGSQYVDGDMTIEFWLAENITGHATNVVTATFSSLADYRRIHVLQFSGVAASSAHDAAFAPAGNTDATSPYTTTADDTTVDGEMIIGFYVDSVGGLTYSDSSPSVFRLQTADTASATNLIATAGSGNVAVAGNGSNSHWCYSKAIKPAAAASSIVPVLMRQYRARRD